MKERILAKRYGKALFELALETNAAVQVSEDIMIIATAVRDVPVLLKILSDEMISEEKRISLMEKVVSSLSIGKITGDLLKLLIAKNRIKILNFIIEEVTSGFENYNKLANVRIFIADRNQAEEISKRVKEIFEKEFKLAASCEINIEPEILGGFILRFNDIKYDASISGKLEQMKQELMR